MNWIITIVVAVAIIAIVVFLMPKKRKHWQAGYRTIMMDKPEQKSMGYSEPKQIDLTIPESYRQEAKKEENEPDFKIPPGMFD